VDCDAYIANCLSAHADGELSGAELHAAVQHVAGCDACRARLAEERAVKTLVREHAGLLRTPVQVRRNIAETLKSAADDTPSGSREAFRGSALAAFRRPRQWIPAALVAAAAAAAIAFLAVRSQTSDEVRIPVFDIAVDGYDRFERHFIANVPSESAATISDAYMGHKMPGYLWNFGPSGYRLVGGRLETLFDGRQVAYTFYSSDEGHILCTYLRMHLDEAPPGAVHQVESHYYYVYRGHSICLNFYPGGSFICILVSRRPFNAFLNDIAASAP
jgi:Putative zinc-finger